MVWLRLSFKTVSVSAFLPMEAQRPPSSCSLKDARVVTTEIDHFTETGIQMTDGEHHEFDLIVCATGFEIAFAPHL